ncbi:uncharacterized protein NKAPD1-like isoform X2 [Mya arenaria]|uniref:uncharacterized protein NKAPD1-like isoform X2 n=1 Tax=Mya arenaria TaxID=6604 RepID=UPI0022E356FA|nr:uncharacterized protein NKAPD1-like isoform X2 [Mya arenaria]
MSNKSLVSNSSKTLLKNVIRHTDSHNKIIEENEMWRQWKTEQQGPEENNPSFLKGQCSDMRYEFPKRRNKRAYMDEEPQSTFWMKELYKTEEADENRWGHNGYKELYPEQFGSSRSLTHTSSTLRATHHTERHKKTKSQKHRKRESIKVAKSVGQISY